MILLDMIYEKFNKFIEEKFFSSKSKGEIIFFSVDDNVINDFIRQEHISYKYFKERMSRKLKHSWESKTNIVKNGLGLCALQIYIAHQMHENKDFSSREYNGPLSDFLGIKYSDLNDLYKDHQDSLWSNLKLFCDNNDFQIMIPSSSTGKGRYVQYPFSQTLLNKEDLKNSPILFERAGIKKSEYLPLKEFSKIIESADNGSCMRKHYYQVKKRLLKYTKSDDSLNEQLFHYFMSDWDGVYPNSIKTTSESTEISFTKENLTFILNSDIETISVLDSDYNTIDNRIILDSDIFKIIEQYQKLYNDDFLIFEKDNISDESIYVRKFERGKDYVLICKNGSQASILISELGAYSKLSNYNYDVYKVNKLNEEVQHHLGNKYFLSQSRTYKIDGGLKLNRKTWMFNCGPKIIFEEKSKAWLNGERINSSVHDCTNMPVGIYRLKVSGFPPERFEIAEAENNVSPDCEGWTISKYDNLWSSDGAEPNFIGLFTKLNTPAEFVNTRTWINSLTNNKDNTPCSNQVINAIIRNKNRRL